MSADREELLRRAVLGEASEAERAALESDPEYGPRLHEMQGIVAELDAAGAGERERMLEGSDTPGEARAEETLLQLMEESGEKRDAQGSPGRILRFVAAAAAAVLLVLVAREAFLADGEGTLVIEDNVPLGESRIRNPDLDTDGDGNLVFSWEYELPTLGRFWLRVRNAETNELLLDRDEIDESSWKIPLEDVADWPDQIVWEIRAMKGDGTLDEVRESSSRFSRQ